MSEQRNPWESLSPRLNELCSIVGHETLTLDGLLDIVVALVEDLKVKRGETSNAVKSFLQNCTKIAHN
jgi:hypothetical protein